MGTSLKICFCFSILVLLNLTLWGSERPDIIYVSNDGNDTNDGLTVNTSVKTIARGINLNPKILKLRAGDTFYESVMVNNIEIDSFGIGSKPNICGLKILKGKAWERGTFNENEWHPSDTGHIWKACLSLPDSSYLGIKTGGSSLYYNIGQIVDLETNSLNGSRRVRFSNDLVNDYDFWLNKNDSALIKPVKYGLKGREKNFPRADYKEDYNFLFVYSTEDLNTKSIGLAVYDVGARVRGGSIRNVKVSHWGRCGITGRSNTYIDNCEVDAIGGSYFIIDDYWNSYGNGIEFYVFSPITENCRIQNCTISRCYDAGFSIQGSSSKSNNKNIRAQNILFENNIIENCNQSFEFFLNGTDSTAVYENCIVRNNLSLNAGINSGFRIYVDRYKYCHILETSRMRPTGIIYDNNIFANGNYYCSSLCQDKYNSPIWRTNKCYIMRGQDLIGNGSGKKDVITLPTDGPNIDSINILTQKAIDSYRKLTDDYGTQFIIINEDLKMTQIVDSLRNEFIRLNK